MMQRKIPARLFTALLLAALASPMHAQVAPAPDAPPAASTPRTSTAPAAPAQPVPTFELSANLVSLFFVARGPHGQLIPDLTAADCAIQEDSQHQTIRHFTAATGLPLTLGILLDTSLSQQRVLSTEQQAAAAFLRRILQPKDEAFLLSFDVDATLLADFTSSPGTLQRAIDRAHINANSGNFANGAIPSIGRPQGTVLYDAVYLAATDKLRPETGRKALILLTDGEDEGSRQSLAVAIRAAQKADAIVYVLLIQDSGPLGLSDDAGAAPMRKLAQATGGEVFPIGSNGRKMQAAFDQIKTQLRSQYQATYTPSNKARDGSYRRIRVECSQNGHPLHVQVRQGYYADCR